jgi:hypothetical protein
MFPIRTNKKPIYDKLLNRFHGFTVLNNNKGLWQNDGIVYKDNIDIIQIFANRKSETVIKSISKDIKRLFKQQSVMYTTNNKVRFV